MIRLEAAVRASMIEGMNKQGIPVIWVNLEDLGNWPFKKNETPVLHIHIFGRASTATKQLWPEAVFLPDRSTGFYDGFEPLTAQDIIVIGEIIKEKFTQEKYSDQCWGLNPLSS